MFVASLYNFNCVFFTESSSAEAVVAHDYSSSDAVAADTPVTASSSDTSATSTADAAADAIDGRSMLLVS